MRALKLWNRDSEGNPFVVNNVTSPERWYRIAKRNDGHVWQIGYQGEDEAFRVGEKLFPTVGEAFDDLCAFLEWQKAHDNAMDAKEYADAHGLKLEALANGEGR